ncbi:hypothetical protein FRC04_007137 [Tulasnella sp. 424]|nr:hypothetical protein FRC04_007137 [Tulasnella sp. 424]KAG8959963.1 hypothetical protein FRC05_007143 [Tulasnella sp. 425]
MPSQPSSNIRKSRQPKKPYDQPNARRTRRVIPRAERVVKKAARDAKQDAIHEKICELWQTMLSFAEEEAPKINATVDDIITGVLSLGRKKSSSRKPNPWNAHQYIEAKKRREENATKSTKSAAETATTETAQPSTLEPAENDIELHQQEDTTPTDSHPHENLDVPIPGSLDHEHSEMGDEENIGPTLREAVEASKQSYLQVQHRAPEEVEFLKQQLESHRAEREAAVKKQFLAHKADVRKTLDHISQEIKDLGHRCEIEVIAIAVRTKLEHRVEPRVIATEEAKKYFQKMFKQEPIKFAFQMENYFTTGLFGTLARNANQRQVNLKSEIRTLLSDSLAAITNETRIQFPWTDFFSKITEGYMVEIKGWPLNYFTNPSDFKTKADMEAVRDALLTGSCHFAKIDKARLTELKVKRAKAKSEGRNDEVSVLQNEGGREASQTSSTATSKLPESDAHVASAGTDPLLPGPPAPIATYQDVFSVSFNTSSDDNGVPLEIYPSSSYNLTPMPNNLAPLVPTVMTPIPSNLIPLPANFSMNTVQLHPNESALQEPLETPTVQRGKKRQRWDVGLDRDCARETKQLAEAANLTPAEYLASHPEILEKAKRNKQQRFSSQKQRRAVNSQA